MLRKQPRGEVRHRDVGRHLDRLHEKGLVGGQFATSRWSPLLGGSRGAGLRPMPHQLDRKAVADAEMPSRRPAGMTRLDKGGDPHPQIERIASTHDPPPSQRENHSSAQPRSQRVLFPVRRSRMGAFEGPLSIAIQTLIQHERMRAATILQNDFASVRGSFARITARANRRSRRIRRCP
jgi:hypothetical protein